MRTALVPGASSGGFTGKATAAVAFRASSYVRVIGAAPNYVTWY